VNWGKVGKRAGIVGVAWVGLTLLSFANSGDPGPYPDNIRSNKSSKKNVKS